MLLYGGKLLKLLSRSRVGLRPRAFASFGYACHEAKVRLQNALRFFAQDDTLIDYLRVTVN